MEGQGREPRAGQEGGGSYGGKAEPVIRGGARGCGGPHGGKAEPVIRGGVGECEGHCGGKADL